MKRLLWVLLLIPLLMFSTENGRWGRYSKGRTATVVIAAYNSFQKSKDGVDYVCDGTADNIEIQMGIDALPAIGGKVLLMEGDYSIDTTLFIPSNTELCGLGNFTKLTLVDSAGTGTYAVELITNANTVLGDSNITIRNLSIDGNKDLQREGNDDVSCVQFVRVKNLVLERIRVENGWTSNIRTKFCKNVTISTCISINSGDDCIAINEGTIHATVINNFIKNPAGQGLTYGGPQGIEVQDGASNISVIGNHIYIDTANAGSYGIYVGSHVGLPPCSSIVISDNTYLFEDSSETAYGIFVGGKVKAINVIISNNTLKADTTTAGHGITIDKMQYGIISQNTIEMVDANAINIWDTTSNVIITDNIMKNAIGIAFFTAPVCDNIMINNNRMDNSYRCISFDGGVFNDLTISDNQMGYTWDLYWDNPSTMSGIVVRNNEFLPSFDMYPTDTDISSWYIMGNTGGLYDLFFYPQGYHLQSDSIILNKITVSSPTTGLVFVDTTGGDTLKIFLNGVWEIK